MCTISNWKIMWLFLNPLIWIYCAISKDNFGSCFFYNIKFWKCSVIVLWHRINSFVIAAIINWCIWWRLSFCFKDIRLFLIHFVITNIYECFHYLSSYSDSTPQYYRHTYINTNGNVTQHYISILNFKSLKFLLVSVLRGNFQ